MNCPYSIAIDYYYHQIKSQLRAVSLLAAIELNLPLVWSIANTQHLGWIVLTSGEIGIKILK
jgi:hypothetical protein